MFAWFTFPDATSTMTSIGTYSAAMFTSLFDVVAIVAGLLIGGYLVSKFLGTILKSAKIVLARRGGRRRRR